MLVNSEPWWNEARVEFASAHDRPWTPDDQALCMGGNSREWAEIMQTRLKLPDVTVDTIPAMGHMGPITHPNAVARRIAEFVRKHAFVPGPVARELAA
mgnify:CR=1 FL=1